MSSKPLFNSSRNALLERLRLSDLDPKSSSQRIVDTAITEVRVGFFNELGETRVAELQGFGVTDSPSTTQEIQRADAIVCETKWTRALLLQVIHVFFADQSGEAQQEWNDLGILRDKGADDGETIDRLMSDVGDALERLRTQNVKAKRQVRATSFGATERIEPGSTIWG